MLALRKLRAAMGLSQSEFGVLIGRSHQSIQNYEKGVPAPRDVVERAINIAVERGYGDIAVEIRGEFEVKNELRPGELLISASRPNSDRIRAVDIPKAHSGPRVGARMDRASTLHAMLDKVLASGNADAITAVENNLVVFAKFVDGSPVPRSAKGRKA